MAGATFTRFPSFVADFNNGVYAGGLGSTYVMLSDSAPSMAFSSEMQITDIAAGNGYTAGGTPCTVSQPLGSNTLLSLVITSPPPIFQAVGSAIVQFRYPVLYTKGTGKLIGFWDYQNEINLQPGACFSPILGINLDLLVTLPQAWQFIAPDQGNAFSAITSTQMQNLVSFRAAAHHHIADFLGFEFLRMSHVNEPHDGNGMHMLYLKHHPISALYAAQFQEQPYSNLPLIEVRESRYLWLQNYFFSRVGVQRWLFTYDAGWPVYAPDGVTIMEDVPDCIRIAALKLMALYYSLNGVGGTALGKASITTGEGGGMISYDPDAEKKILETCYEEKIVGF